MEPLLSIAEFLRLRSFRSKVKCEWMVMILLAAAVFFSAVYALCSRLLYGFVIAASTVDFTKYELEKQMTWTQRVRAEYTEEIAQMTAKVVDTHRGR